MSKHGKKYQKAIELIKNFNNNLSIKDALSKIKQMAYAKFDESIDVDINLGIDLSKPEQSVKGSVILPQGTGRSVRIVVFAKGDHAEMATKAGADFVGTNDLFDKISAGWLDFDYVIATPDMMGLVGKLAKILGPRGLLPNVKIGTVTFDVKNVITDLKKGKIFFKNSKTGQIHSTIGKASFGVDNLYENFTAFIKALIASKPPSAKGQFLKKITISSTMGPGIQLNLDEVLK